MSDEEKGPPSQLKGTIQLSLSIVDSIVGIVGLILGVLVGLNFIPFPPELTQYFFYWIEIMIVTAVILLLAFVVFRYIWKKSIVFQAVIIFIVVALVSVLALAGAYHPPEGPIHVNLTSPADNGTVGLREFVRGTSTNLTRGTQLWIMVKPHNMNILYYYPQNYTTTIYGDGSWSAEAYFGNQTKGIGEKFDIIPVLANDTAQASFNTYLKESASKGSWEGLAVLPNGADRQTTIVVTRTSNSMG
jgi:hypothetical protein